MICSFIAFTVPKRCSNDQERYRLSCESFASSIHSLSILPGSHDRIITKYSQMKFTVEFEREDDGRWLAGVLELPGVLAYGQTSHEAIARVQALALRTLADLLEHSESAQEFVTISFAAA